MLMLCFCSRERIGVQFDVCVEQCVGAARTTSRRLERRLPSIDSSNIRYDLSVRLPSKYLFACLPPSGFFLNRREHLRPSRIPLSAFIVEDMTELARAHATYRFVVLDEEEERPSILVRASLGLPIVLPSHPFPSSPRQKQTNKDVALQAEYAPVLQS